MVTSVPPPALLIVAGHDPSGGAGLTADAALASRLGLHPVSVVTALTLQDSTGCSDAAPVPALQVVARLDRLRTDFGARISAVKIGMLGSVENALALAARLSDWRVPTVFDPVIRASRGVALLSEDADAAKLAIEALLPHVTLVTPNRDELAFLAGHAIDDLDAAKAAARALVERFGCAVLAKGGHLPAGDAVIDLLATRGGVDRYAAPRMAGTAHGTGCALSTGIAARLALGATLAAAVAESAADVRSRLIGASQVGHGERFLALP